MSRLRYIAFRSVQTVFMLWLVLTMLFFFFRLMPGDFTDVMLAQGADPESVAAFEEKWGLNDPLHVQYWQYLTNFVQFDVGTSIQYRIPVWEHVNQRIFNSFILIAPAITAAYVIGSIVGTLAGRSRGSAFEKYGVLPFIVVGTFPSFFTAIVLVIVFAGWGGWFPTSGMYTAGTQAADAAWWEVYFTQDFAKHYILPFTAVLLRYLYLPTLIMRTSVVEVLGQDFSFYRRMTGVSEFRQKLHTAKHASLPVVTLYPVSMTRAIGGLVLIEYVFNWPGIGRTLVEAVMARDIPVVMFVFFLVGAFIIIANFVVDIVYGVIDPRVSISES